MLNAAIDDADHDSGCGPGTGTRRISASGGVALSAGTDHPEAVLRDAEAALYRAKALGGGHIELFGYDLYKYRKDILQQIDPLIIDGKA